MLRTSTVRPRERPDSFALHSGDLVELSGIELEPLCGRLSPQAKS